LLFFFVVRPKIKEAPSSRALVFMQSFRFQPAVARWFDQTFGSPTEPQVRGWPAIQSGRHVLISAPTGSGKTLAAFLASLDLLFREGMKAELPDEIQVVYVSPLKALSNNIRSSESVCRRRKNRSRKLRVFWSALVQWKRSAILIARSSTSVIGGNSTWRLKSRRRRLKP